jgi:hypothetical protein
MLTTKSGYDLETKVLTSLGAISLSLGYIKCHELAQAVSSGAHSCRTGFEAYMKQLNVCLSVCLSISSYLSQRYVAEKKLFIRKLFPMERQCWEINFVIKCMGSSSGHIFPHFVVRKKSTGTVTTMNIYSLYIFFITMATKCVVKVKKVTHMWVHASGDVKCKYSYISLSAHLLRSHSVRTGTSASRWYWESIITPVSLCGTMNVSVNGVPKMAVQKLSILWHIDPLLGNELTNMFPWIRVNNKQSKGHYKIGTQFNATKWLLEFIGRSKS